MPMEIMDGYVELLDRVHTVVANRSVYTLKKLSGIVS